MASEPRHPITPKDMKALTGKFFNVKVTPSEHKCPECGAEMRYRWTTGTYKGQPKVAMIFAECINKPENSDDHGFGPKSKHTDTSYKGESGDSKDEPKKDFEPFYVESNETAAGLITKGMIYKVVGKYPNDNWIIDLADDGTRNVTLASYRFKTPEENSKPEPKKEEKVAKTETKNAGGVLENLINGLVDERLTNVEAMVKKMVEQGALVKTLEIKTEKLEIKIEGLRHPVLDEMLERYAMGERTFLLTGPAGTGKTTIARQFSKAIKAQRCTVIACSEDLRREAFVGFRTYNIKDGTAPYVPSPVVEDLRVTDAPTCTILEEIDASNPNALLTINALENGFLPTPECSETPEHARPAAHVLIATANTWGTAGSTQYVGRNQLDAATLDRYRTIFVDYDITLEKALVADDGVVDLVMEIRRKVNEAQIRKVVSTRLARRIAFDRKMAGNAKKSLRDVAKKVLVNSGWQAQELTRVGM